MDRSDVDNYAHPRDGGRLTLETGETGAEVKAGFLVSADGDRFAIEDGLPDLTWPRVLEDADRRGRDIYDDVAAVYDSYIHLTFDTFRTTEEAERRKMVDRLHLKSGQSVLEFGCGTGRTSALIAEAVGPKGRLFLQDLSRPALLKAREKAASLATPVACAVANGCFLPMVDASVDAVFHFGGINMFSDIGRCLREAVRVVRPGGRVVVGDENMPVWLRETEMGRVLMNSNPHYRSPVPFDRIPVEARDVACEWIIGGVFYVLSFSVGEGEPYADLDFPIPGRRGGTHRTRYYGNLEGVTPEARALALEAAERSGMSVHAWLEEAVRRAAGSKK